MTRFLLRAWTGPALVKQIADKVREAGFQGVLEGTEHVMFEGEGTTGEAAAWDSLVDIRRKHGSDFGLTIEPLKQL